MSTTHRRTSWGIVPQPRSEGETALYRFFGEDERLLYVGISDQPMRRWAAHTERPWWRDAVSFTVEWFESRALAEDAEKTAIKTEEPKWNVWGTNRAGAAIRAGLLAFHARQREREAQRTE